MLEKCTVVIKELGTMKEEFHESFDTIEDAVAATKKFYEDHGYDFTGLEDHFNELDHHTSAFSRIGIPYLSVEASYS